MPARAFIKSVTGHCGYGGCDRCTQKGVYVNCVTFPDVDAPLRSDESFRSMTDKHHHNNKEQSPLTELPIDMVFDFPLDYMHLVCLGVVRKLISLWMSGPLATRIGRQAVDGISKKLVDVREFIPACFQRKPRQLSEYERWKATELRQLLLYTGPVVLIDNLPKELYDNFLLLSVGVGILLNPELSKSYSDFSHNILVSFVKHFGELYGSGKMSYNVHGLVHLKADLHRFGVLDNISSFPFESFLGKIKRSLRKPGSPLEQIVRRLSEQSRFSYAANEKVQLKTEHSDGPVVNGLQTQYKEVNLDNFTIRLTPADRFVLLSDGNIARVENIYTTSTGSIRLIYRRYHNNTSFFEYPLPSIKLGIVKLGNNGDIHDCDIADVIRKYMVLPYKKHNIGIPVLHSC